MNILIIEDELPAREKLIQMLSEVDPSFKLAAALGSVRESIAWLKNNPPPEMAFADIQLSDDHSFEIFRTHPVKFPVVFTTAYDKYLLDSFEFNSIDYLLKPISMEKLKRSLEKVRNLREHFLEGPMQQFFERNATEVSPLRIVARKGTEFVALEAHEIAYFYTEQKIVFSREFTGRKLIIDNTLSELESKLKHSNFFRINRKFLANAKAIERFRPDNGKVLIYLKPEMREEIHVSKETAPEFRQWITQKTH